MTERPPRGSTPRPRLERLRRTDQPSRPSEVGLVLWVLVIVVAMSG